jgi:hypothetical protein
MPMPVTRNQPRVEFYAALRFLLRALVTGGRRWRFSFTNPSCTVFDVN